LEVSLASEFEPTTKADDVGVYDFPPSVSSGLTGIPITVYAGDGNPSIYLVSLTSDDVTRLGYGEGPAVAFDGSIAYCDAASESIVLVNAEDVSMRSQIAFGGGYCPPLVWSRSGNLSLISQGASSYTVRLYDGTRLVTTHDLPFASSYFDWASPTIVAFQTQERTAIMDLGSATIERWLNGVHPSYAPGSGDDIPPIAVLARENQFRGIRVYDAEGNLAAETRVGEGDVSFTWSPDGESMAIVDPREIRIWSWRDNKLRVLATVSDSSDEMFLPAVAWID